MVDKKVMNPFVISVVVIILVLYTLILLDPAKTESRSTDVKINYHLGHDEYGKNTCSYDEYSYDEYSYEECDTSDDGQTPYNVFDLVR